MFGMNLKKLRKKGNLTQEDLANSLSVSRQAVSMWERGERTPKIPVLAKIAKTFGVSMDHIVNEKLTAQDYNLGEKEKTGKDPKEILVVDDEKGIRDLLVKALAMEGYILHAAEDGETAIMMLKESSENDIDLVLLDLKLPGMSGVNTLKQIKKIQEELPVIMISAYDTHLTSVETEIPGVYKCLRKPFTMAKIREVVKNATGNKH